MTAKPRFGITERAPCMQMEDGRYCARCGHPESHHGPTCVWRTAIVCGCPGFKPRLGKPCLHCGHPKGKHGHRINFAVPAFTPGRVTYFCVGDCGCTRHSDWDPPAAGET